MDVYYPFIRFSSAIRKIHKVIHEVTVMSSYYAGNDTPQSKS